MTPVAKIAKHLKSTELLDARGDTDTIRLWENYRDQALLWRTLAIFQMPATLILLLFSVVLWATHTIKLVVPAKPLPGIYIAKEVPDTEFIETATEFVNLVASYQPAVARRQFLRGREMLREPMLERFDREMLGVDLKAIENTNRTQIFFADPTQTFIERLNDKQVLVTLIGERLKIVSGKELPIVKTRFNVTMTTVPHQALNPYGIVVVNATYENIEK